MADIKVVIIRDGIAPLFVAQVQELDKEQVFKLVKEAEENRLKIEGEYSHSINVLKDKVEKLEKEVKILKGED